jgi:predicted transposase YdaD
VAILLNRKADSPSLTGHHRVLLPEGPCYLDFRYSVVRVWKLDVEQVLRGGPAILPLAPLAKVGKKEVPSVIRRMKGRLEREVPEDQAGLLWTSTKVLMGLKYSRELIETLLRGVQGMKESVTYQAILEEGWAPGEQRLLLQMGRKRFGEPSPEVIKRVEAITEESILWKLGERLLDVSTWDELLSIL